MTDQDIVELYWNRSENAISETDHKYGSYCRTVSYHILYNYEDSEECVSDTWMHAWNTIPPQRPELLKAFLGKIVRNLSLDLYRKQTAQKRGGGETEVAIDELAECLEAGNSVEGEVLASELKGLINAFLDDLQKRDRQVFMLRYFYARNAGEIAKACELTESNVNQILSRSRKKLQEFLRKEGYLA